MKARDKGRLLRKKYGITGRVDVQDLADRLGLQIDLWHLPADDVQEVTVGSCIGVSAELDDTERRWAIAHAIGHRILHPGNIARLRVRKMQGMPFEREAEQFAYGLLVDEDEALAERLPTLVQIADHFGIPMHTLWENAPDTWGQTKLL